MSAVDSATSPRPRPAPPPPASFGEPGTAPPPLPSRTGSLSRTGTFGSRPASATSTPVSLSAVRPASPVSFNLDSGLQADHPLYSLVSRMQDLFRHLQDLNQEIQGLTAAIQYYRNRANADGNLDQQAETRTGLLNRKQKLEEEIAHSEREFQQLDVAHNSKWSSNQDAQGFSAYQIVSDLIQQLVSKLIIPDLPSEYMQRKIDVLEETLKRCKAENDILNRSLVAKLPTKDDCCVIL